MSEHPWTVPVVLAEIPETGRHLALKADEHTRAALAKLAGVRDVSQLEAEFELTRQGGDGVHVVGNVSATVEQQCVLTLEPMETRIEEPVDLVFAPQAATVHGVAGSADAEPPEVLRDGVVDLGAVATEFLLLGIDPYPRKPGAIFEAPKQAENPASHPFAALAALKKGERRDG